MSEVAESAAKVQRGERLSFEDGRALFLDHDILRVGALANQVRERQHGDRTYFNVNMRFEATNVCQASCSFCAFAKLKEGAPGAHTTTHEAAWSELAEHPEPRLTELHMVNGLHPGLPFDYYTELLAGLKRIQPSIHLKAFTAVEIFYFAKKFGMPVADVLARLRAAGLDSIPGGGAEIFAPRVRKKICDDKCTGDEWLDVHRTAHRVGLRSNCTMLYGTIETVEERVDHMLQLRALQDETGGFQAFIPLAFHPDNNALMKLPAPTGVDDLRTYAVARLMLHNIPHIKAYWIMLGVKTAQTALWFGADDLDGTVQEEKIYHMAGAETPQAMSPAEIVRIIRDAGRAPVERDTLYNVVAEGAALAPDKPFRRDVRRSLEVVS